MLCALEEMKQYSGWVSDPNSFLQGHRPSEWKESATMFQKQTGGTEVGGGGETRNHQGQMCKASLRLAKSLDFIINSEENQKRFLCRERAQSDLSCKGPSGRCAKKVIIGPVVASSACHNKVPQTGRLKTTETYCLTVLEARRPKSRC